MPSVPYVPADLAEPREIVDAVRARRGGHLTHLDRMLLHSPPLADGWMKLFTVIRYQTTFAPRLRELVIARVGVRNGARYEIEAHREHALAEGVTAAQLTALGNWRESGEFDATDRAILAYTDAITDDIKVNDEVFAVVRKMFTDRQMVELTGTIAAYSFVSRFLVAMQIEPGD